MDCINGADERNCFQLETNECDPKSEYRCSNGQCIPEEFFFDLSVDCLDGSDEYPLRNATCSIDHFYFCEDLVNSIGEFSCGDGQFLFTSERRRVNANVGNYNCLNGRNIVFTRTIFICKCK